MEFVLQNGIKFFYPEHICLQAQRDLPTKEQQVEAAVGLSGESALAASQSSIRNGHKTRPVCVRVPSVLSDHLHRGLSLVLD